MRKSPVLAMMLGLLLAGPAAAQTVGQPPEIGVYTKSGEATIEATIEKMRDLYLVVRDAEDGLSDVTAVSLEGGHLAAAATISTVKIPVPIAKAIQVSVTSGEEYFEIVDEDCTGNGLSEPGLAGDSCSVTLQAIPVDNGDFTGTLSVKTLTKIFEVPLELKTENLTPATLTISENIACQVNRTQEQDCGLFQIENTGFFAAVDFDIVKSGDQPGLFAVTHTCGEQLKAGESCSLKVTATSLIESGVYSAQISLRYASRGTGEWTGNLLSTETRTALANVTGLDPAKLVVSGDANCVLTAPQANGVCGTLSVENVNFYAATNLNFNVDTQQNFSLVHDCPEPLPRNSSCNVIVSIEGFAANETRKTDLTISHESAGAGSWGDTGYQATKSNDVVPVVTAIATGWVPKITIAGDGSEMNIIGPGDPAYGANRTFTFTNVGYVPADAIEVTVTNGKNFEFVSNPCDGVTLPPQGTCQVVVRSVAKKDGAFSGSLRVAYNGNVETANLSGSASNMWTYDWDVGSWGSCSAVGTWSGWSSCSASCGSGSQSRTCSPGTGVKTRSVTCLRDDGTTVDDSYCETTKPDDSEACTAGCTGSASQSCTNVCTYTITCQHTSGTQRSWSATGLPGTWTSTGSPSGQSRWATRIENHSSNLNCLNGGQAVPSGWGYIGECQAVSGSPYGRGDVISWCRSSR